jgi:hypothetical protein
MNVIKHLTAAVSKGVVTVQIECRSPVAARKLLRDFSAAERAGASVFNPIAEPLAALTDRQIDNLLHGRQPDDDAKLEPFTPSEKPRTGCATIATVAMPVVA